MPADGTGTKRPRSPILSRGMPVALPTRGRCGMRPQMSFFTVAAAAAAVAIVGVGSQRVTAQSMLEPDAAMRVFYERVESYATLHRRLAPPPPVTSSTDPISRL